jgi:hypothetical protein
MAWASTRSKDTYLRSKYNSLVGRRGKKRSLIAVAHKILCSAYFIIKEKVPYNELGPAYLDNRRKDKILQYHMKKIAELGYELQLTEKAA